MISKIIKLQNVGLLQNATSNGAVPLAKATAIYAENGRGKSTLSAILRAAQLGEAGRINARKTIDSTNAPEVNMLLSNGSRVDFSANVWTSRLLDIVIFDSEFVEQNVYSGFEVRADQRQSLLEFALGQQTVPLQKQINQLAQDSDVQSRKRSQAEKGLTGFASPYNVENFIALRQIPDAQAQIETIQKRIEAANIAQVLVARKDPLAIAKVSFDVAPVFVILKQQILDVEKSAEAVVRAHMANHSFRGIEGWVSDGQQYLDGTTCPLCGQTIDGLELLKAYRSYFNKSYNQLKLQVGGLKEKVELGLADSMIVEIKSAISTNVARLEAWKDRLSIAIPLMDMEALGHLLKRAREELLTFISAKQQAPLESIGNGDDEREISTIIEEINQVIITYNASLQTVQTQITEFKKKLASENIESLKSEIQKLEAAQRRVLPNVLALISEYRAADAEWKRLNGLKAATRKQLDALMDSTLQQYQADINRLLSSFGADFSIEKLKPTYQGGGEPRSEYGISIRNKSVGLGSRAALTSGYGFATTLSEADKRTLAFAFFLARLYRDPSLVTKLIVLDDPVASLDRNRRTESIKQISSLVTRCEQLIVLSHDAYFVRELKISLEKLKPASVSLQVITLKRVAQNYSAFDVCDIDDICASDYYRNHKMVADYVKNNSGNLRDVAKAIRPLLEGYYHRRFPGMIPNGQMFGQIIALANQASEGSPLSNLRPALQEMTEVNSFAGEFHHDTNPNCETVPVSDSELLTFAKRALSLIYKS